VIFTKFQNVIRSWHCCLNSDVIFTKFQNVIRPWHCCLNSDVIFTKGVVSLTMDKMVSIVLVVQRQGEKFKYNFHTICRYLNVRFYISLTKLQKVIRNWHSCLCSFHKFASSNRPFVHFQNKKKKGSKFICLTHFKQSYFFLMWAEESNLMWSSRFPCLALFASVWFYFSLLSAVFSFMFVCKQSYFPFMSIKKSVPYFCVLRKGYYVIIWLIVRICVFIKDWKLIYSKVRNKIKHWQKVQDREISDTLRFVGDLPVLHFLLVLDSIFL
jgi:hypothetical protein